MEQRQPGTKRSSGEHCQGVWHHHLGWLLLGGLCWPLPRGFPEHHSPVWLREDYLGDSDKCQRPTNCQTVLTELNKEDSARHEFPEN